MFNVHFWRLSKNFRILSENLSTFGKFLEKILESFSIVFGKFSESFWKVFGKISERFRKVFGTFPRSSGFFDFFIIYFFDTRGDFLKDTKFKITDFLYQIFLIIKIVCLSVHVRVSHLRKFKIVILCILLSRIEIHLRMVTK